MTTINTITTADIRAELIDPATEREIAFYEAELASTEAGYEDYLASGGDEDDVIFGYEDDIDWLRSKLRECQRAA